jgi:hypothetical protein
MIFTAAMYNPMFYPSPTVLQVGTAYNAWTSSLLLGKYLWLCSSNSAPFSDLPILPISISSRSILELGCGVGVVGFTAAKLGGHVTMSDFNDDVLRNVAEALQLNELTCGVGGVEVAKLDWGCEGGESEGCTSKQRWYGGEDDACVGDRDCAAFAPLKPDVQFDIVLAADCCYEPDHPRLLCRLFLLLSSTNCLVTNCVLFLTFSSSLPPHSSSSSQRAKASLACRRICGVCLRDDVTLPVGVVIYNFADRPFQCQPRICCFRQFSRSGFCHGCALPEAALRAAGRTPANL